MNEEINFLIKNWISSFASICTFNQFDRKYECNSRIFCISKMHFWLNWKGHLITTQIFQLNLRNLQVNFTNILQAAFLSVAICQKQYRQLVWDKYLNTEKLNSILCYGKSACKLLLKKLTPKWQKGILSLKR